MLTIHSEQIGLFKAFMRERFVERLLGHVRNELPRTTAAISDSDLCAIIRAAVIRAGDYGVTTEWDLCRFAMYDVRLGPPFEKKPGHAWALEVLQRAGLDGVARMDLLDKRYFAPPSPSK